MRSMFSVYNHNQMIKNKNAKTAAEIKRAVDIYNKAYPDTSVSTLYANGTVIGAAARKFIEAKHGMDVILPIKEHDSVDRYINPVEINEYKEKAEKIAPVLFSALGFTDKIETGPELIKKVISLDKEWFPYSYNHGTKLSMTQQELRKNYKKLIRKPTFVAFDIETFSGTNKYGQNNFMKIQEYAFGLYRMNKGNVSLENPNDPDKLIATIIGITDDERKQFIKTFSAKEFNKKGYEGSVENKVIAERLAKIGMSKIEEDPNQKGMFRIKSFPEEAEITRGNILAGIDKLTEIGKKQDKARRKNGLMAWEDELLNATKLLNDNTITGYNINEFDIKNINKEVSRIWNRMSDQAQKEKLKELGLNPGDTPMITGKGGIVDVFDYVKAFTMDDFSGRKMYGDDSKGIKILKEISRRGNSPYRQEELAKVYGTENAKDLADLASHSGLGDTNTIAKLARGPFLKNLMEVINDNKEHEVESFWKKGTVFLNPKSTRYYDSDKKNMFDFELDPVRNVIRTASGLMFDKEGKLVEHEEYDRFRGISPGAVLKIAGIREMTLGKDALATFRETDQTLESPKVYAAVFDQLVDEELTGGDKTYGRQVVMLAPNMNSLTARVSQMIKMGELDNKGKFTPVYSEAKTPEEASKTYRAFTHLLGGVTNTQIVGVDGQARNVWEVMSPKTQSAQDFMKKYVSGHTLNEINERAGRLDRESSYSKAKKMLALKEYMNSKGVTDVKEQQKLIRYALNNPEDKDTVLPYNKIVELAGYQSSRKNEKGEREQTVIPSTVSNIASLWENFSSKADLQKAAIDAIESNPELGYYDKQVLFRDAMNVAHQLGIDRGGVDNRRTRRILQGYKNNYMEFKMPEGWLKDNSKYGLDSDKNDIVKVSLGHNAQYSLIDTLLNRRVGRNYDKVEERGQRDAMSTLAIRDFILEIQKDPQYKDSGYLKDAFKYANDKDIFKYSPTTLSGTLLEGLSKIKEANPAAGLISPLEKENVMGPETSLAKVTADDMAGIAESLMKNYKPVVQVGSDTDSPDFKNAIANFVDTYAMPKVKLADGTMSSDIDDVIEHLRTERGYSKKQLDMFRMNLSLQRNEYMEGYEDLIYALTQHNMGLGIKDGRAGVIAGENFYAIDGLAKSSITNDVLGLSVNGHKYASPFKIYTDKAIVDDKYEKTGIYFGTSVHEIMKNYQYLNKNLNYAQLNGEDLINVVKRNISDSYSSLREESALTTASSKEMRTSLNIDLDEIVRVLPYLRGDIENYNGFIDPKAKDFLLSNMDSIKKTGNGGPEIREVLALEQDAMLRIIQEMAPEAQNDQSTFLKKAQAFMTGMTKESQSAQSIFTTSDINGGFLRRFNNMGRPQPVSDDNKLYDIEKTKKLIDASGLGDHFRLGSLFVTNETAKDRTLDGGTKAASEFRSTIMSIGTQAFQGQINDVISIKEKSATPEEKEKLQFLRKFYSGLTITEQGKVISQRAADIMFEGTEDKKIALTKNILVDKRNADKVIQKRMENAMPTLMYKDHKLAIKLSKGEVVTQGSRLLAYDSYGDQEGFEISKVPISNFSVRFFNSGTNVEVGEDRLNEVLNEHFKDIDMTNGTVNMQDAFEVLRQNGIDPYFVNRSLIAKGYNKITIDNVEKGMARSLGLGIGMYDTSLRGAMDVLGLGMANGHISTKRLEEQIIDSYKGLSKEQKDKLASKYGYKTGNEIVSAIRSEKYMAEDYLMKNVFPNTGAILFTQDIMKKHGNIGLAITNGANNMIEKLKAEGMTENEAVKATYAELKKNILSNYSTELRMINGHLKIVDTSEGLDVNEVINKGTDIDGKYFSYIEDFQKKIDDYGVVKNAEGKTIGRLINNNIEAQYDYSGKSKSVSIHGMELLEEQLGNIRKQYDSAEEGSLEKERLQEQLLELGNQYKGLKGIDKHLKISGRELENLRQYGYDDKLMGRLKGVYNTEDYNRYFGRMLGVDGKLIKERQDQDIYDNLASTLEADMVDRAKQAMPFFETEAKAAKYNDGRLTNDNMTSPQDGIEAFKKINIRDLVVPSGENAEEMRNNPDNYYKSAFLVNTGLTDEGYKNIAVPHINYEDPENNPVQQAMNKMKASYVHYKQAESDSSKLGKYDTVDNAKKRYIESIDNVKRALTLNMRSHIKEMESGRLNSQYYSYMKATSVASAPGMINPYHMLKISQVDGKSLADWSKQGVIWDASWVSEQDMKDRGYFNKEFLEKNNMTKEQMMDYLQTHGTIDYELRTPTINEGSGKPTRVFLDPTMTGEARNSFDVTSLSRNQDHDGDAILASELAYKNKAGESMTFLEYQLAKDRGEKIDDGAEKFFSDIASGQAVRAGLINPKISQKAADSYKEDVQKAINEGRMSEIFKTGVGNYNDYTVAQPMNRNIDTKERLRHEEKLGNLYAQYLNDNPGKTLDEPTVKFKELNKYARDKGIFEEYKTTFNTLESQMKSGVMNINKAGGKASIGEINVPLFAFRRMSKDLGVSRNNQILLQSFDDQFEQSIISKKKSEEEKLTEAKRVTEIMNNVLRGATGSRAEMNKLLDENEAVVDKIYEKAQTSLIDPGKTKEEFRENLDRAMAEYIGIAHSDNRTSALLSAVKMSNNMSGSNADKVMEGLQYAKDSILYKAGYGKRKEYAKNNATSKIYDSKTGAIASELRELVSQAQDEISTAAANASFMDSKLAMGALGLAGAIMAIGYIGGKPSQPDPDVQPKSDEEGSLQDQDMTIQQLPEPGSTNQGYVININAESPRGRKHAQEALQKAMYGSVPTNVNIAMNVQDKTSRISPRLVDKFLAGAL